MKLKKENKKTANLTANMFKYGFNRFYSLMETILKKTKISALKA